MSFYILSHVLAFAALCGFAVLSLLTSAWPFSVRVLLVLMVPMVSTLSYQSWRHVQGWPTATDLPSRFLLNATVIVEANEKTNDEGAIYLWLTEIGDQNLHAQPRAYRLDYDAKIHLDLQQAKRKIRDGQLQIGEWNRPSQGLGNSDPNRPLSNSKQLNLTFRDLPDPALPEK